VTILAPDQIETIRDETRLLEDQQDVTPMGLAFQAIELGSSSNPLEASLRRVVRAMKI
jgi:cell division protein FtsA